MLEPPESSLTANSGGASSAVVATAVLLGFSLALNAWFLRKIRRDSRRVRDAGPRSASAYLRAFVVDKAPPPRIPMQTRVPPRTADRIVPKEKPPPPVVTEKPRATTPNESEEKPTKAATKKWQGQVQKPPPAFAQFAKATARKPVRPVARAPSKLGSTNRIGSTSQLLGSTSQLPLPKQLPASASGESLAEKWRPPAPKSKPSILSEVLKAESSKAD